MVVTLLLSLGASAAGMDPPNFGLPHATTPPPPKKETILHPARRRRPFDPARVIGVFLVSLPLFSTSLSIPSWRLAVEIPVPVLFVCGVWLVVFLFAIHRDDTRRLVQ